jgi:type II secretory pathway pseudopilin PulG
LIELLVVIAIIALLISVLAPALGRARENGRRTVCGNDLRQVGQIFWHYSNDYDGWFPAKPWCGHPGAGPKDLAHYQGDSCGRDPRGPDGWGSRFAGMVRDILERDYTRGASDGAKYLIDPKVLVCPSDELGNAYGSDTVLLPIRPVTDVTEIDATVATKTKNYSYMYISLLRNDDRADFFLMGDESNRLDIGTASLTGLTNEDNHGLRGINALFVDLHVDWTPVKGGDYQSVQQMAWKLWAPASLAPARFPISNGNRSTELETID